MSVLKFQAKVKKELFALTPLSPSGSRLAFCEHFLGFLLEAFSIHRSS